MQEAAAALPQVLRIVGSIVAPTTLLTALLFYFGRLHAQGLTRYFRAHYTLFNFTVQDYLVRSADGLFLPVTIGAALTLVAIWLHRLLLVTVDDGTRDRVLRVLMPVAGVAGLTLVVLAVVATFIPQLFATFPEAGGLSLAVAVLLLAYFVRLLRLQRGDGRQPHPTEGAAVLAVAEWGAVFILVSIGLFWAVNSYAIGVGTTRAQQIERGLASSPDVVLYSEKSLDLHVPGVRELVCSKPEDVPEAAYRFRYEGLKFVWQVGDQFLLLPTGWTRSSGPALVLPRTDSVRLEFTGPGRGTVDGC